jgi:N12 class adenine-specific DNA methylase
MGWWWWDDSDINSIVVKPKSTDQEPKPVQVEGRIKKINLIKKLGWLAT